MSISWKVLAAAAAVTAVLSGCSSVSLDEGHAKWLAANPEVKIVIQGNTDERGGREYNLALGQKRSEAVLQRLQLLGIPSSRIEAVSFGKEKPIALGHSEEAWAQNRRADIVYPESVLKAQPAAK